MELRKENTTRKIDSLGRVSIPKSMRERLEIVEGDEMEFFMLADDAGEREQNLKLLNAFVNVFARVADFGKMAKKK